MMSHTRIELFSGSSHPEFAKRVAEELGIELSPMSIIRFANDNIKVRPEVCVRGADVFVIQTSVPPVNDHFMELLIMIDALKHASAGRITSVMPYYPYVRSDKKDEPRISITARLVADLVETAGADRVLTMNLHSPQIQGFFRIPADQLLAIKVATDYFKENYDLSNAVVVAPDAGSAKRAGAYATRLNLPLAVMDKRRLADDDQAHVYHVIGEVEGKDAIIFDDEISTAGSMIEAEKALRRMGAKTIRAFAVHGVLVGPAIERLKNSTIDEVVVTNTIPLPKEKQIDKITVLDVAPLFAEAIKRIHYGESVSALFKK